MRKIILLLLFAICLHAKEPVKIVEILDTNLFLTENGDTLSMAFIETISIYKTNEQKHQIAMETIDFLKKTFKHYKIFFEYDSTVNKVELYKKYPLGFESINQLLLSNGLATTSKVKNIPMDYTQAESKAKHDRRGLYRIFNPHEEIKYNSATWINLGIGRIIKKENVNRIGNPIFCVDGGVTKRGKNLVLNGGYTLSALDPSTSHHTFYTGFGYSFNNQHTEAVFTVGPSLHKYSYDIEYSEYTWQPGKPKTFKSDIYVGLQVKAQLFAYIARSIGFGFSSTANFTKNRQLYFFTLNLILGGWF